MVMLTVATVAMGAVFASAEVSAVAFCGQHGSRGASGLALAAIAAGSAVAGLVYGAREHRGDALDRLRRQAVVFARAPVALLAAVNVPVLVVAAFVVGIGHRADADHRLRAGAAVRAARRAHRGAGLGEHRAERRLRRWGRRWSAASPTSTGRAAHSSLSWRQPGGRRAARRCTCRLVAARPRACGAGSSVRWGTIVRCRSTVTRRSSCGSTSSVRPTASSRCSPAGTAGCGRWARGSGARRRSFGARLEPGQPHRRAALLPAARGAAVAGRATRARRGRSRPSRSARSARSLANDYARWTAASAICETAERLTEEGEPALRLYLLVVGALRALAAGEHDPGLMLDAFFIRAMSHAGWEPALRECAECSAPGPHARSTCRQAVPSATPAARPARPARSRGRSS